MALTDTSPVISYAGNGSLTPYPIPFYFQDADHIRLTVDGTDVPSGFTVEGAGLESGQQLTPGEVYTAGQEVVISRLVPVDQPYEYQEGDSLPAADLEAEADYKTMQIQQISEQAGRAVRMPIGSTEEEAAELLERVQRTDEELAEDLGYAADPVAEQVAIGLLTANARITINEADIERSKVTNGQTNSLGQMVAIGDSLFGTVDPDVELPAQVGEALGSPITVQQQSGWIPRHMVWRFLMVNCATVLRQDLQSIPPEEYENRINQPDVEGGPLNNLRTFFADGQQKWVHETYPGEATSQLYQYDAASTATIDGDDVLICEGGVGRWLKQAGTYSRETDYTFVNNATFLVWLGANGMEQADLQSAIEQLSRNIGPGKGKIWLMTLINRLHKDHASVADWKGWIDECNNMLRDNFENIIEMEDFVLGQTFDHFIPADSDDVDDVAAGVLPRSLKDGTGTGDSHFSQHGNNVLARYIASTMASTYNRRPSISTLGDVQWTRFWQADGLVALNELNEVVRMPSYQHTDDAISMTVPSGSTAPALIPNMLGGKAGLRFRNTGDCLENTFGNQNQANTLMCVMRFTDGLSSRADVLDTLTGNRHLLRRNAVASGEWSLFNTGDGATGIATDSDWHVIIAKFDGATSAIWVDGTKTVCTTDPGTTGCAGVGININPSFPFVGDIMNVGFLNSGIADADATAITTKLRSGYGLG